MATKKVQRHKQAQALLPPPGALGHGLQGGSASSLLGSGASSAANVQIHTYQDANKSIDELLQAARSSEAGNKIYERRNKSKLPPSFYQPRPMRHRGSSAGHSPQGSSDDGFSTSRNTLSPSSLNSGIMAMGPGAQITPFHKKQASAPELDNRNVEMYTNRPSTMAPAAAMTSHHHYSKSVSAIEPVSADPSASPSFGGPSHIRSVSYDVNQSAAAAFQQQQQPQPHRNYLDPSSMQPVYDPRGKSQSLDPMLVSSATAQQQQPAAALRPGFDEGLPPGWSASVDHATGDYYFINHIDQTTTWYDPRLPHHLQEDEIRKKHAIAGQQQHQGYPPAVQQQQQQAMYAEPIQQQQGYTYMQQLEMERHRMKEKREQIYRDGLLGGSPQSYGAGSPMIQTPAPANNNLGHEQYQYQMPQGAAAGQTPYGHSRNISNDSAVNQDMEVDYPPAGGPIDYHIDTDVNPREFDRYLRLTDPEQCGARYQ